MKALVLALALTAPVLMAPATQSASVPTDWIVVTKDKKGNPTGYVTWKERPQQELAQEFCVNFPNNALPYPDCFQDPGGPESDDDDK